MSRTGGQTTLSSTPVPLVFNPTAGRGRAGRLAAVISASLSASGVPNTPIASRAAGDVEKAVAIAVNEGHRRIVVAGGDGSVHEAVNGILSTDPSAELGVIPIGTGNDFAKASSIPLHWEHAAALLADRISSGAPSIPIDAGRCNNRYFANSAGIGFDAKVAAIAAESKLPIGDLVYLLAVFKAMREGIATPNVVLTFGNEIVDGQLTLASFSNGPWVGGLFHIAPPAHNDDGFLDLVYAEPVSRRRLVALLPKILRGRHYDEPEVRTASVRKCELALDAPVVSHLDGEIQPPQDRFTIEVMAGAIRLL